MNNEKRDWEKELIEHCTGCGSCSESCRILTEINETPGQIASRGLTVDEAFSCALCGKCEAVCPEGLSPYRMFEKRRVEAVAKKEIDVNEYCYLFPDRSVNVMSIFRDYYGVDYSECNLSLPADTGFFPGCTMMTYSPGLTKKIYNSISKTYSNPVLFTECCGLPMYQIGLPERGDKMKENLLIKIKQLGVKRLIIACPNCYYQFKKNEAFKDIELLTVYEVLKDYFVFNQEDNCKYAVHDSCPDRFEGIFAKQVREALDSAGCQRVEMKHKGIDSICCGSSGQLGHFKPEWSKEHELQGLKEAAEAGADIMIAYCQACVLNFGNVSSDIKVRHALNILLKFEEDYDAVKKSAAEIFQGPDSLEIWEKLMG
ncbi:MAG: (Fe-S)-binding protein [Eubacteriales bacterium]